MAFRQMRRELQLKKMQKAPVRSQRPEVVLGRVIGSFGSHCNVRTVDSIVRKASVKGHSLRTVTGDFVWMEKGANNGDDPNDRSNEDKSHVIDVLPRYNSLIKFDENRINKPKTVAANIDYMYIVASRFPQLDPKLIDRYLVTAESMNIPSSIIYNKCDMDIKLHPEHCKQDSILLQTYKDIGYPVFDISAKNNTGIDDLKCHISQIDRICSLDVMPEEPPMTIMIGASGVGKSTLLHTLIPDLADYIATGDLNKVGRGTHTTTNTKSYTFRHTNNANDGDIEKMIEICDSPGMGNYKVPTMSQLELRELFPEFHKYEKDCRFKDCLHLQDKGCAVKKAYKYQFVDERRYEHYVLLSNELKKRNEKVQRYLNKYKK